MNWDYYRYFLATARTGSLKEAARKLKVNHTTVSRNITALEDAVGARLFERRSNGFVLTSAGQRILKSMEEVEEKINEADRILAGKDERAEGTVKIAMPGALANHWLIPRMAPFIDQYPGVGLEFLTGPSVVNLARREADLAIRFVEPKQSGLIVRRIGHLNLRFYGHRQLFKKSAPPKKVGDLSKLPFIGLYAEVTSSAEDKLLGMVEGSLNVRFRSAAWSSVYAALQSGLGVGILPEFLGAKDSNLVPILKDLNANMSLWLVYHPDLKHAARVRVLIDFVSGLLTKDFR